MNGSRDNEQRDARRLRQMPGKPGDLGPCAEPPFADPNRPRGGIVECPVELNEEMTVFVERLVNQLFQTSVVGQIEIIEPPPFEAANAQDQFGCEAMLPQFDPEHLPFLPSGKDDDGIRGFGRLSNVEEVE